jgi:hypothetical protein
MSNSARTRLLRVSRRESAVSPGKGSLERFSPARRVFYDGTTGLPQSLQQCIRWRMKMNLAAGLALLLFAREAQSDDRMSPKPTGVQTARVLLHVAGSDRVIDFNDVSKVLCSEAAKIVFETHDGHVVVHQGTYTLIQQRNSFNEHQARGIRFYDAK